MILLYSPFSTSFPSFPFHLLYFCQNIHNLHTFFFCCYPYLCFVFKSILKYIPWTFWKYQSIFFLAPSSFITLKIQLSVLLNSPLKVICFFIFPFLSFKIFFLSLFLGQFYYEVLREWFSWFLLLGSKGFLNLQFDVFCSFGKKSALSL